MTVLISCRDMLAVRAGVMNNDHIHATGAPVGYIAQHMADIDWPSPSASTVEGQQFFLGLMGQIKDAGAIPTQDQYNSAIVHANNLPDGYSYGQRMEEVVKSLTVNFGGRVEAYQEKMASELPSHTASSQAPRQ